jgi:hypothetical protein
LLALSSALGTATIRSSTFVVKTTCRLYQLLPARLNDTRNLAPQSEHSETDSTQIELPHVATRSPALSASVAVPDLETVFLRD